MKTVAERFFRVRQLLVMAQRDLVVLRKMIEDAFKAAAARGLSGWIVALLPRDSLSGHV